MPVAVRFQASLDRLIAHNDRDVRLQAARCVSHLPGAAGMARIRELAEDNDAEVRLEALRSIARRNPQAGRATLRRAFAEDIDLRCRRAALQGLIAVEDRSIIPALRRLVRNPDAFIYEQSPQTQALRQALCCEAVDALGLLGDASVVDDLMGLLDRHVSAMLDDAVIRALAKLGEAGRRALEDLTRASTPTRARRAVEALAEATAPDEVEALALFLGHPDVSVRLAAAQALARLQPSHSALLRRANDPEASVRALIARYAGPTMPTVLKLLLDDPAPTVAAAALSAIGEVPAAERTEDLVLQVRCKLRHPAPEVAAAAMGTLAALDFEAALPELGARLADPTAPLALRITAARTLAALGTPGAFAKLADHVFVAEPTLRRGVLESLVELGGRDDGEPVRAFLLDLLTPPPSAGLAEAQQPYDVGTAGEDPTVPADIRGDIAELLAVWPTPAVEAALVRLVDEPAIQPVLRLAASLALAQTVERLATTSVPAIEAALGLLEEDDPRLRLAAMRILVTAPADVARQSVPDRLDDADPSVRALAIRWLGDSQLPLSAKLMACLEAALDHRNVSVRLAAVGALVRRRGTAALDHVIESIV
ncbi:MAG: HEAT repeat domain-containing protein, partial [Pseudomonadota bacterium]